MKVALIEHTINDNFKDILKEDVIPIIINSDSTFKSLTESINSIQNVTNVVIAQHLNINGISIGSEDLVKYTDDHTWSNLIQFLIDLKSMGVVSVDFLACLLYSQPGVSNMFTKLEAITEINLRASTDDTGNVSIGGNWILESDMIDIQNMYFNQSIENFNQLFRVARYSGDSFYPNTYASSYNNISIIDASGNVAYIANGTSTSIRVNSGSGPLLSNASKIYANDQAFACIDLSKNVYIWGSTGNGGNGQTYATLLRINDATTGTPVSNIVSIWSTRFSFAAIDSSSNIYIWGRSKCGGNGQNYASLLRIDDATTGTPVNASTIIAGWDFFAAISTTNEVYRWGALNAQEGNNGGAGNNANYASLLLNGSASGPSVKNIVKLYCTRYTAIAIDATGIMYKWGYNYGTPGTLYAKTIVNEQSQIINNADKIYMSYNYYCILTTDKKAFVLSAATESSGTTQTALALKINSSSGSVLTNIESITSNEHGYVLKTTSNQIYLASFESGQGGPTSLTTGYCILLRVNDASTGTIVSNSDKILGGYGSFCLLDLSKNVHMWGHYSEGGNGQNYSTRVTVGGSLLSNVKDIYTTSYYQGATYIAVTTDGKAYKINNGATATQITSSVDSQYLTNINNAYASFTNFILINNTGNTYYFDPAGTTSSPMTFIASSLSNSLTLTVNNSSPTVDVWSSINLQVYTDGGSSPYAYKWYKSNVLINGAIYSSYTSDTNQGLYINDTQIQYKCRVEDNAGYYEEVVFNVTYKGTGTTLPKSSNIILDLKGEDYTGGNIWKDTTRDICFNMVNITRDAVNNGPKFNGNNSYAERVAGVPNFTGIPFTVICYYYKNSTSTSDDSYATISRTISDYHNEFVFAQYQYFDYGTSSYGVNMNPTINAGTTGLRMASVARDTTQATLYLNDQLNGTATGNNVTIDNDNFYIGIDKRSLDENRDSSTDALNGTIKRFVVYNTALTSAEIASVYNILSNAVVTPLNLDASTENISVYKHLYNANDLKQLSVSATGGSGSYTYSWSGSGIVSSSGGSAYIQYRGNVTEETITVTVTSESSSATKTFNITYINPAPVQTPSTTIPDNTLQITSDNRVAANVSSGIGKFIGQVTTVNQYTPPSGQGIVTLAAKLVESTNASGFTSLNFDVDKYKSDGSKFNSTLGSASTYGTIQFDISANRSFGINWIDSLGTTYSNIVSYTVLNNVINTTYNTSLTYTTSNGRNYFTYTGPNSQTIILVNPIGATGIPCFVAGTRIMTPDGEKLVEDLRSGDIVLSADGRKLPATVYSTKIAKTTNQTAPYLIKAGTFGSTPNRDLYVSGKHAIQSAKGIWQIPEFSSSAKQVIIGSPVEYYHIELPNYFTDNIVANGIVAESLANNQIDRTKSIYIYNNKRGGFVRNMNNKLAIKH
jgi:hypothetical protein